MTRWYVTVNWDDYPEGGSYGTIVEAETSEEAERLTFLEMGESRADEENDAQYYVDTYGDEWEVVDCWDLDAFIRQHRKPIRVLIEATGGVIQNISSSDPAGVQIETVDYDDEKVPSAWSPVEKIA